MTYAPRVMALTLDRLGDGRSDAFAAEASSMLRGRLVARGAEEIGVALSRRGDQPVA